MMQTVPSAFAAQAFPSRLTRLKLKKVGGKSYDAFLRWSLRRIKEVYLTKGWMQFCKDNHLRSGSLVRFKVSAANEGLILAEVVNV